VIIVTARWEVDQKNEAVSKVIVPSRPCAGIPFFSAYEGDAGTGPALCAYLLDF
jgi:hypothetical protein